ncbi:MAG: SDR family NAD(P)-dependent oxidoreductase [Anaerolineae bacterium]|nr:SDR family NAD(P)-dependent oxidoreductase [Anaerolineae bacterium]
MTAVAFITGASSGIGRAAALEFARQGIHVAGIARRSQRLSELEAEINQLPAPHGEFLGVVADVTDPSSLADAVAQTVERFGRLDILVANAGLGHRGVMVDAEWHDLHTVLQTNIEGVLHSIRAAVPAMRQNGEGHIIIVSSVSYNLTSPYTSIYAASKAFVSSLANSIRLELAPEHIAVTDILVGRTETEFNERRLGEGKRAGQGVPTMPAGQVAQAIVKAAQHRPRRVILRLVDRLIIWGNILVPGLIGQLAKRQYR